MSGLGFDKVEEVILGEESDEEWLHFVGDSTPDYMYEHWQNSYEAQMEIDEYVESVEVQRDRYDEGVFF